MTGNIRLDTSGWLMVIFRNQSLSWRLLLLVLLSLKSGSADYPSPAESSVSPYCYG